jgi:hypothetical protein
MRHRLVLFLAFVGCCVFAVSVASASTTLTTVSGTAVLLSKSGSGPLSSTSSNTNIFAPSAYVDYKRFGGEPTVTVDRYPFPGSNTTQAAKCSGTTPCFKDVIYASSPNGFAYPHYSPFWKSDDLGMTFRVPCHFLAQGQTCATGGGGGDSHSAVGQVTHRLFFVDLPGPGCVTANISDDLGETFVGDNVGCGPNPGAIDDRQWVEADEKAIPCQGGTGQNAYISFINFSNLAAPTLSLARSCHDGNTGTFVTDSVCNTLNAQIPAGPPINPLPTGPSPDSTPSACPDPADKDLQIAGPVVADKEGYSGRPNPTHPRAHVGAPVLALDREVDRRRHDVDALQGRRARHAQPDQPVPAADDRPRREPVLHLVADAGAGPGSERAARRARHLLRLLDHRRPRLVDPDPADPVGQQLGGHAVDGRG